MSDKEHYDQELRVINSLFWYGLAIILIGCVLIGMKIPGAAALMVLSFFGLLAYGIYKTHRFHKLFKQYWRAQGLDDKAIMAKWHEIFSGDG